MTGRNRFVPANRRLVVMALICGLLLPACSKGFFAPETKRDQFIKMTQSRLVGDESFEWQYLSSAIIVRALPYDQAVQKTARQIFSDSPAFTEETAAWLDPPQTSSTQPIVVIMGLYAPGMTEEDITKNTRFRPKLLTADGRTLEPLEIQPYGRDNDFIRDHFPIFNPWEEIFVVKFSGNRTKKPLTYQLHWPGGVQTMTFAN